MRVIFLSSLAFLVVADLSSVQAGQTDDIVKYAATVNDEGVQVVEMTGGEYYFRPNYIIVKAGVPVKIVVKKSVGIIPHNMTIDEPGAGMKFSVDFGTDGKEITFTPTEPGIYPFYCDKKFLFFKSHRDRGMEGLIEVIE